MSAAGRAAGDLPESGGFDNRLRQEERKGERETASVAGRRELT